jgi:hypothetical protein
MRIAGRFACEERPGHVSFRVRRIDYEPWLYGASLLLFGLLATRVIPGGPMLMLVQTLALACVMRFGGGFALWRAMARSTYPRVRTAQEDLSVIVDGRPFSRADAPRMIVATSEESADVGKNARPLYRFRPTLVMTHALCELAVYEGHEESNAKALAFELARALDPHATAPPCVRWTPPRSPGLRASGLAAFLPVLAALFALAGMVWGLFASRVLFAWELKEPVPLYPSWPLFGVAMALLFWNVQCSTRQFADRRTRDAKELRESEAPGEHPEGHLSGGARLTVPA